MGPVRMISSGHELTTDYDEKTLHELGFKDMQVLTNVPKSHFLVLLLCYNDLVCLCLQELHTIEE